MKNRPFHGLFSESMAYSSKLGFSPISLDLSTGPILLDPHYSTYKFIGAIIGPIGPTLGPELLDL